MISLSSKTTIAQDLMRKALKAHATFSLNVSGASSMAPLFRINDTLLLRTIAIDEVRTADIIVFCKRNRLIAHRCLHIKRKPGSPIQLVTKGDALRRADPYVIIGDELLGIVTAFKRNGKDFNCSSLIWKALQRLLWIYSCTQELTNRIRRTPVSKNARKQ